jgi:histidine ammonia-lyase
MTSHYNISAKYSLDAIQDLLQSRSITLEDHEKQAIRHCRQYLERQLESNDGTYYGINTGFGALCDFRISDSEIQNLQQNLIRSHACGTGDVVDKDIVRILVLLKIISLSRGYSGVRVELVERLIRLYNEDALPIIYEQGSLGASGDLAPLSHLGLVVIGEGDVHFQGRRMPTIAALEELKLTPLVLQAKEGLAILNGTQFSTAHALWACLQFRRLMEFAHACATLSIEAFNCSPAPYHDLIHHIRNQAGQQSSAARIRSLLEGSDIANRDRFSVQDPYAFRCVPQVHGASLDAFDYIELTIVREVNGVTDNPNIFAEHDLILSGGNFHAQPIAYACDFLAIAAAEIGSISERRIYQLVSGLRDLPTFLSRHAGTHSGLMIPQYTAASIVSQNKQLCTPASVDSITSSIGQEDHVSMAANAGTKLIKVIKNLTTVLSIEWMTAAQAMEFRPDYQLSAELSQLLSTYRSHYVPVLDQDRILYTDIELTSRFFSDQF